MSKRLGKIIPGNYEATLVLVKCHKGRIDEGATFVLKLATGEDVAWYTKAFTGPGGDGGVSLKTILYFMLYPFESNRIASVSSLPGRHVGVVVESKEVRGKAVPVITGFCFSTKEMFRLQSDREPRAN